MKLKITEEDLVLYELIARLKGILEATDPNITAKEIQKRFDLIEKLKNTPTDAKVIVSYNDSVCSHDNKHCHYSHTIINYELNRVEIFVFPYGTSSWSYRPKTHGKLITVKSIEVIDG